MEEAQAKERGTERPEWVGEQSRRWDSVFNRELSTPGFFQTLYLVALLSSHLLAPVVLCLHSGLRVSACVWHVCGRGRAGGGEGEREGAALLFFPEHRR